MIIIYTDGSCNNKTGYGGYGIYIKNGGKEIYLHKGYKNTTSNRMEMRAILYALKYVNKKEKIIIYSDSMYCVNSIMKGWVYFWERDCWYNRKNADIWKRILIELRKFRIQPKLIHQKGHLDNLDNEHVLGNNIADLLASVSNFKEFKEDKY